MPDVYKQEGKSQVMKQGRTYRQSMKAAGCTLLLCLPALPLQALQFGSLRAPAFQKQAGSPPRFNGQPPRFGPGNHSSSGQHLPQWFAQHQNLSPTAQEDALKQEPGFARLPGGQQQQVIDRLHRLDLAPPAQRQRMMERNERFEALPPERRQDIRGASQALSQMPPDRRQAVRQAFRELRALPLAERQNALGSARFQAEYSPAERSMLDNLLSIEPYHPPQ